MVLSLIYGPSHFDGASGNLHIYLCNAFSVLLFPNVIAFAGLCRQSFPSTALSRQGN
jgi:hypothetical protein